jgi:hypothetical protein
MVASAVLFVRIRDSEGRYLGGEARKLAFFDDIHRAIIFDCQRDRVHEQVEYVRETKGIELEVVPVDPKEIYDSCDGCGRLALSFQLFFDGKSYRCPDCRLADSASQERL